jgi:hypothetical protein
MQPNSSLTAEERLRSFPTLHRLTNREMVVAIVLWILLTIYSISYSYARGKLAVPIGYDDSIYFLDGYARLQQFYMHGVPGVAKGYVLDTPHAPISSLLACLGFVLFGVHDVSPYLLNSVIAFVFLVYALKFFRTSIPAFRWVVLAYVCSVPLTPMGIIEFRPDFAASLFLALGILTTISEPFVDARPAHLATGGAFFGLSIFSKPTFVPFIVFIWGCSITAAVLTDFFSITPQRNVRRAVRSAAIHGTALTVVALLDLAFGWRGIVEYIRTVLFSDQTKVWTANTRGTPLFQALYYLTGPAGKQMLGGQLWVLLALIGIALFSLPQKSREAQLRWISLLALIFIAYAFFSVNIAKDAFFGLPFQILMVFAAVAGLEVVLDLISKKGLPPAAPCAVAVALALPGLYFLQPLYPIRGIRGTPHADFMWDANNRIIDTIAAQKDRSPVVVYISAVGDVNSDTLLWMAVKRALNAKFSIDPMSDKIEGHLQAMRAADVIVAPEPGIRAVVYSSFPSARITGEILRALNQDSRFVQTDRIRTPDGKYLFVFINNPFRGWMEETGMGPIEGPYPEERLPRVRWALGNETRIVPEGVRPGLIAISGSAMTYTANQQMTFHVGQDLVGTVDLPETKKFVDFTFPAKLETPWEPVLISYSMWDHTNPALSKAVMFQRLTLTNTPIKTEEGGAK